MIASVDVSINDLYFLKKSTCDQWKALCTKGQRFCLGIGCWRGCGEKAKRTCLI